MNKKTDDAENALKAVRLTAAFRQFLKNEFASEYGYGSPWPMKCYVYNLDLESLTLVTSRQFNTRYGQVKVALRCCSEAPRSSWLACSFMGGPPRWEDHPASQKFDHWKQNLHFEGSETVEESMRQIVTHLRKLGIHLEKAKACDTN